MRCENPADAQLAGTYTVVGIDIELHIHGEWAIEVGFGPPHFPTPPPQMKTRNDPSQMALILPTGQCVCVRVGKLVQWLHKTP